MRSAWRSGGPTVRLMMMLLAVVMGVGVSLIILQQPLPR